MKPRVGLGHETPVAFAPEIQRPLARLGQAGDVIGAARLEQQYLHLGISASRPAITDPDDPAPHTMTS